MKKLLFFVVLISTTLVSFAQKPFNQVFRETVELNKTRFADVNLIQPGDTVLLPAINGSGTEAWIASYPMYIGDSKKHDCIWKITERYMNSELTTFPVDTIPAAGPIFIETPEEETDLSWLWWLLPLIFIIWLGLYAYYLYQNRTVLNRDQVVPGGLSDNAATAATQIQAINPGRIARVERGIITGDRRRILMVMFNNGPRMIFLNPGQSAYRVTELDGNISYYLQHCGNLVGMIANGRFALPEGWTFVPDSEANSTANTVWERQPAAAAEEVVVEAPIIPVTAPTPTPSQEVPANAVPINFVEAIKAIGEMKVTPKKIIIKNGELDITVEFPEK